MRSDIKVVLGGVGLIKGDIREAGRAMIAITEEINPFLVSDGFLDGAPFELLNGIIRFGTKRMSSPEIRPIDKKHRELPFAVEVEMAPLKRASVETVKAAFLEVLIPALFEIASKYNLPTSGLASFNERTKNPRMQGKTDVSQEGGAHNTL